ncbi:MAG TPA: PadR family transcriptional regulator [Rhodopila sp.]
MALIERQPRHGYELIRTITGMFDGHYTPSPGSIYPTLTLLEEMELVSSEPGARKLYSITEAGRAFLAQNREMVDAVMARTEHSARMVAKMGLPQAVREAMAHLKHALLSPTAGWDEAETGRVAGIIERAANEIGKRGAQD